MRLLSIAIALGLLVVGCEADADTAESDEAPEAVAPVVVDPSAPQTASVTEEGSAPTDPASNSGPTADVEELRTRIAVLEEQLAACQSGSATAPTEVTVRDPAPSTTSSTTSSTTNTQTASQTRRGRVAADDDEVEDDRPPSLIEQVLGGGRRAGGDDDEDGPVLLDPSRILGR